MCTLYSKHVCVYVKYLHQRRVGCTQVVVDLYVQSVLDSC